MAGLIADMNMGITLLMLPPPMLLPPPPLPLLLVSQVNVV